MIDEHRARGRLRRRWPHHPGRAITVCAVLLCGATLTVAQDATTDVAIEARVQRVLNGMVAPVVVAGQPVPRATLADRMEALRVPGVSIAVIRNGGIEWARGVGVTRTGGSRVTTETLFQAASISKPVTAMAVLRLVQDGSLRLDADVNQFLESWKVPDSSFTERNKVTLRALLSHTAGMRVYGFQGYPADAAVPTLLQVLNGERPPANSAPIVVDTTPGATWRYSGGGYVVMQQVLEDVTGSSFPALMHDLVLAPLGMTSSAYAQPLPVDRRADAAAPHDANGRSVRGGAYTYPELAPAGLWTTAVDLARFALEVQNAHAGRSARILTRAMIGEMLKPDGLGGWGLGLKLAGSRAHPGFEHDGANEGFGSLLFAYSPHEGDGVVVLTNGARGLQLAGEIRRAVAVEYNWPDFQPQPRARAMVNPEVLDRYAGYYRIDARTVHVVTRRGRQLFQQRLGLPSRELVPESARTFFVTDVDAQFSFDVDSAGGASSLSMRQGDTTQLANRIAASDPLVTWTDAVLLRVAGQTPDSGSAALLTATIDDIRDGGPAYDRMTRPVAFDVREWLPRLQRGLRELGALRSLTFKEVTPNGSDMFQIYFDNGSMEWHVRVGADGLVENLNYDFE